MSIFICCVETAALKNFTANNTGHNIPDNVVALTFACDARTNEIIDISGDTGDGDIVDITDVIYDRDKSFMAKPTSYEVLQPLIDTAKANCTTRFVFSSHRGRFNVYNG